MVRVKRDGVWHRVRSLGGDPVYFITPKGRSRQRRPRCPPKVYPVFPPIEAHNHRGHSYRLAALDDLDPIVKFVDKLLRRRDFFCPPAQHRSYLKYKTIVLTFDGPRLIGWAVRQKAGSLIHLLVDTDYRGQGIGSHLLEILEPLFIRSKSDQSTGDPLPFYEKHGYAKTTDERIGKNKNIDLLTRQTVLEGQS